ncbi:ABC transporter permease [Propioniciclava soli]|uniref:ABC transporter permease n=1 Tax=Propioniciclava soli TaxID=2775081 RepID=UPI001E4F3C0B|nr:ABC transporter permease [Propioniciclava soli]
MTANNPSASGPASTSRLAPEPRANVPETPLAQMPEPRRSRGGRFLAKRAGFYLLTAWVALTINFFVPRAMPGDPAQTLALQITRQTGTTLSPEVLQSIRNLYGDPNQNLFEQYWNYLGSIFTLDFGLSVSRYPVPVLELILGALPWTLFLVGVSTLVAWLVGTSLGIIVGHRPGSRLDLWLTPISQFFSSMPSFWVALLTLWVFSLTLGLFPSSGGYSPNVPFQINNVWFLLSVFRYATLPILTGVFVGFSGWLFAMRNMMVTTISEDFVTLARAKGISERRVIFRYAARNAMLPNITGLASSIGGIIGGVVLTEIVFTYPDMGYLLFQAITTKDYPLMQAIFLMIVLAVLVANFIADSLYVLLDPRTREV